MRKAAAKPPNAGKGRPKGVPNKATADVRACVALIAQNLAPEVEAWVRRGARKKPLEAAKVMAQLLEYHMPKLARTEVTGKDGEAMQVVTLPAGAEKL